MFFFRIHGYLSTLFNVIHYQYNIDILIYYNIIRAIYQINYTFLTISIILL